MIRLVTLDLSVQLGYSMGRNIANSTCCSVIIENPNSKLSMQNPNLAMLLHNLKELTELYLDGVDLSAQGYDWCQAISSSLPKLKVLSLSNCFLSGPIDDSFAKLQSLSIIDLSHNLLVNFQQPYEIPRLTILDLQSNRLHGKIPKLPHDVAYVDYSFNQFNSSLPVDIGYRLSFTKFFSVSNNNITGRIPDSICTANSSLTVLDLSNNHLSGMIPSCLVDMTGLLWTLEVLNLGKNNLSGTIPGTFPTNCGLKFLDLHGNRLEGNVPLSLGSCSMLEELNLGNNLLNDTFPCFLKNCTNLRVLTLRSNKLHGDIQCRGATEVWSKLQIIDLASNYFIGHVPRSFFLNWTAMIVDEDGEQQKLNVLHVEVPLSYQIAPGVDDDGVPLSYLDEVTLVIKGFEMELMKILTIFTTIDFSNNRFSGEIPGSIGELKALHLLNMSHNAFTGSIPASIGDLKQLESLDLSVNNLAGRIPTELGSLTFRSFLNLSHNLLEGRIPTELGSLTFLSFLNLSHNLLEGRIPAGRQLQTFTETSFEGNKGLCGSQLNISCEHGQGFPPPPAEEADRKGETNGDLISFEVGLVVGLATFITPLVLSRRWNKWYFKHVDRIVVSKVNRYYHRRNQERKKSNT